LQTELHSNLEALRERIAEAARRAGRDPGAIELVAVTKSVSPDTAGALRRQADVALGENRADELERKAAWFAEHDLDARWHFIGRLQRNKVRRVVALASAIHSIDSARLCDAVEHAARELDRRPQLFLQVKLSDDDKGGVAPADLAELVDHARGVRSARLVGLMTMAPLEDGAPDAPRGRPPGAVAAFGRLAELARGLDGAAFEGGRARLSMGMSSDLEAAIEAGADVVRVGGALFLGLRTGGTP
jgi:pyridoxal phosphate enzyme (YggS family)